ncbi:hypothetical protein BS78_K015200 [Paspalum vaginatum]|uniref:Uncharacterized protein n=1 Tax=Paspalum vaginatum TaxID=158149 RepID=A0A9W7XCK6_9POAL|nr:hypothetical protein BS78_K015200 [Paspalum vaginatum]
MGAGRGRASLSLPGSLQDEGTGQFPSCSLDSLCVYLVPPSVEQSTQPPLPKLGLSSHHRCVRPPPSNPRQVACSPSLRAPEHSFTAPTPTLHHWIEWDVAKFAHHCHELGKLRSAASRVCPARIQRAQLHLLLPLSRFRGFLTSSPASSTLFNKRRRTPPFHAHTSPPSTTTGAPPRAKTNITGSTVA